MFLLGLQPDTVSQCQWKRQEEGSPLGEHNQGELFYVESEVTEKFRANAQEVAGLSIGHPNLRETQQTDVAESSTKQQ